MTEKEASQNSKLLYEVKLHQEVLYQQETKKHTVLITHILNTTASSHVLTYNCFKAL